MMLSQLPKKSWRIAVVSALRQMEAQHYLDGIFRRADGVPDLWIRKFDAEAGEFRREVLTPLRAWKPHGVIVHVTNLDHLRQLGKQFPSVPFVSVNAVPPGMVRTIVAGDVMSALATVRDYFHKCGLSNIAVFCLASKFAATCFTTAFRTVFPDGLEWVCPLDIFATHTPAGKKLQRKAMTEGLRRLPKPVGIMTRETETAPFLLKWCKELGLRVPEEVQIVGLDEEDLCLACEPRLTSYALPRERIGQVAVETMLRLLRRESPLPPPIIQVPGGVIIPRGSTAIQRVGRRAVTDAIDRMKARAAEGLTTADVTRLSKVGQTTFYKQFGAVTGNTPGRYLRKMRIEEACRQLRETNDTVTAVGVACGFVSLQNFVNFFRRQTGQTPSAYRQNAGWKRAGRGHGIGKRNV